MSTTSKTPLVLLALVAAIPGAALLALLLWGAFSAGMLGDDSSVSLMFAVVIVLAGLGALVAGGLPFAIMMWPGLTGTAVAEAPIGTSMIGIPGMGPPGADSEVDERMSSDDEDAPAEEGEQMFDDEALEDDFDDDLGSFDDDGDKK